MSRVGIKRAFRKVGEAVDEWAQLVKSELMPSSIMPMHAFKSPLDLEKFQITTDRVLGGKTECSLTLKQYPNFTAGVFQGVIDHTDDNPQSRGGFASFRTKPDERVWNLSMYDALEMRVKTDGRPYILNVKSSDFSVEHLWQMRIVLEPARWTTIALPFRDMVLTRRGRVEVVQHPLPTEAVNGFGVLLADGRNGPFRFEVQYLRALRDFNPTDYVGQSATLLADRARAEAELALLQEAGLLGPAAPAVGSGGSSSSSSSTSVSMASGAASAASTSTRASAAGVASAKEGGVSSAPAPGGSALHMHAAGTAAAPGNSATGAAVSAAPPTFVPSSAAAASSSAAAPVSGRAAALDDAAPPAPPKPASKPPSQMTREELKEYYAKLREAAQVKRLLPPAVTSHHGGHAVHRGAPQRAALLQGPHARHL